MVHAASEPYTHTSQNRRSLVIVVSECCLGAAVGFRGNDVQEADAALVPVTLVCAVNDLGRPVGDVAAFVIDVGLDAVALNCG